MQQEEGILVLLVIILLSICYFSPLTKIDNFENIKSLKVIDPQINTVIPNYAYIHQIMRPANEINEHGIWADEKIAVDYYGMRPLISSEKYNQNLQKLFDSITDKNIGESQELKYEEVFCGSNEKSIVGWLMQKITDGASIMPEMKHNGPWQIERFSEMDVKVYYNKNFKIIFNLVNNLRSTATLVEAIIHVVSEKPLLKYIGFVNSVQKTTIVPYNNKTINISNINWIYGNTLSENEIIIEGGIPAGFSEKMLNCDSITC